MRFLLTMLLAVFVAISAGACATIEGVQDLKEVTLKDAQLALAWAKQDNDVLAAPCYAAIIDILNATNLPIFQREPIGVLSTMYLGRTVRKDIEGIGTSQLRDKFLLGCAPLMADQRDLLIRMGIKLAPLPLPVPVH